MSEIALGFPCSQGANVEVANIDRIVRDRECEAITGLSRTQRWRLERENKFPKRRVLGPNSRGWLLSELAEWVRSREQVRAAA